MSTVRCSPLDEETGTVRCFAHNLIAAKRISHTNNNPNRAFFCCPKDQGDPDRCDFFFWEDQLIPKNPDAMSQGQPSTSQSEVSKSTNKRSHNNSPSPASLSPIKKSRLEAIQAALTPRKSDSNLESETFSPVASPDTSQTTTPRNGSQRTSAPQTPSTPSRSHDVPSTQLSPSKRIRLAEIEKALGSSNSSSQVFPPASQKLSNHAPPSTPQLAANNSSSDQWTPLTPPSSQTHSALSQQSLTPKAKRLAEIERALTPGGTKKDITSDDNIFLAPRSIASQPTEFRLPRIPRPHDTVSDEEEPDRPDSPIDFRPTTTTTTTRKSHSGLPTRVDPIVDKDPFESMVNDLRQYVRKLERQKLAGEKSNAAKSKRISELELENQSLKEQLRELQERR
ncbi:hypothetical protein VKT23_000839 [Stygiomarasmius scandens]|uniref:GRF-type domain-containing protein n=1 Tax=Marasmiellus scandens TaxID=2682957 RepID=A0ABR1K7V3_9AGAR